jgi:hypothetical protein
MSKFKWLKVSMGHAHSTLYIFEKLFYHIVRFSHYAFFTIFIALKRFLCRAALKNWQNGLEQTLNLSNAISPASIHETGILASDQEIQLETPKTIQNNDVSSFLLPSHYVSHHQELLKLFTHTCPHVIYISFPLI